MATTFNRYDPNTWPRVFIVGGGFAGIAAAQALRSAPVRLTMVDRRNHHVFQPLLYQVATAALSPADISAPIRSVLLIGLVLMMTLVARSFEERLACSAESSARRDTWRRIRRDRRSKGAEAGARRGDGDRSHQSFHIPAAAVPGGDGGAGAE